MTRMTKAQILEIEAALDRYVPIFQFGKGYEQDTIVAVADGPVVTVTVNNPWAGVSGHGTKSEIGLDRVTARTLGLWLLAAAGEDAG